jgi:hypothetical protein
MMHIISGGDDGKAIAEVEIDFSQEFCSALAFVCMFLFWNLDRLV